MLRHLLLVSPLLLGINLSSGSAIANNVDLTEQQAQLKQAIDELDTQNHSNAQLDHAGQSSEQLSTDGIGDKAHVAELATMTENAEPDEAALNELTVAAETDSIESVAEQPVLLLELAHPPEGALPIEPASALPRSVLLSPEAARPDPVADPTDWITPEDLFQEIKRHYYKNTWKSRHRTGLTAQESSDADQAAQEAAAAAALGEALYLLLHTPYPFGAPSTVVGDFWSNTQLFGDWGGIRSVWAQQGIFLDIASTTVPQGVVSGGRSGGTAVSQSLDVALTLSTDLLGWWQGGLLNFQLQSKFGSTLSEAGTFSPVNYATVFPVAQSGNYILPTEYYLFQSLTPNLQLIVGKVNTVYLGDLNVFANSYRYQFQNASLNNNLMLGPYIPTSTWMLAATWIPTPWLSISTAIADPNGSADNFANNFFQDVAINQEFDFSYDINERPGDFRIGWVWSSKGGTDFSDPLNVTGDGRIDFQDPIRTTDSGYMFYANFDQYLYLVDPAQLDPNLSFSTPRGLGLFGRFGIGPESSNLISTFGSFGVGAKGIIAGRPYDEFGLGWYYLNFANGSVDLLRNIGVLLGGSGNNFQNESGIEAYYNFALTPALQLSLDAQYIFNPFLSSRNSTFLLGGRIQINF